MIEFQDLKLILSNDRGLIIICNHTTFYNRLISVYPNRSYYHDIKYLLNYNYVGYALGFVHLDNIFYWEAMRANYKYSIVGLCAHLFSIEKIKKEFEAGLLLEDILE